MKKLIKLVILPLLIVAAISCDDTNKVDYVPPVDISFDGVDENNIVEVDKGVTSYTANVTITGSTKIRSMAIFEADATTGAQGTQIGNDTLFNPPLNEYSFEYVIDGLTTDKAIMIVVEDEDLMTYSKKLFVKISKEVTESAIVIVESGEAYYGTYFGSWLGGRSYISTEATKYVDEIDFSFGNLALNGTDTVAALVSPDKREALGLPFIPGLKNCKFELTALDRNAFEAIPATDGSVIQALASPTQSELEVQAGKVYLYEHDAEKGLIYIGVLQTKKAGLQQQDGSWVENQTYHELRIITKTAAKE